ncbi:nucleotidyltransferase domain-containing protein [Patescibacteria group bacterium]|nr:nucleotidyltransferase domain-containing protein [Patescibacteria group bacterium]MBU4461958.1 nucleotidyltransferase domain-containing protein [Patescibacteria group bacterium]MCG2699901.1 nucleotidyltransferase domain-containing protein [Candidatus Parcubacteria bacterium]
MVIINHKYTQMISLKSKIIQKILNLFLLNEKGRFYVNELAKIIDEDPSNVYKKLLELKKEGIISDDFQGKERYFFINKKYRFLKEYKNIVLKDIGFEKILKQKLEPIKGIKSVYIFGSYARNKMTSESDIDILVVGNFKTIELQKVLLDIQRSSGKEINSIELSEKDFEKRVKEKDPLLKDIFTGKNVKII